MVDVSQRQGRALEALCRDSGIRLMVAFGSQVKGNSHGGSDLDIGILLERANDLGLDLLARIAEVFPDQRVDVALLNRADPLLLKEVSESSVLLAGSEQRLQELRIYAFKRYADYRPYFQLEALTNKRHLEGLSNGS